MTQEEYRNYQAGYIMLQIRNDLELYQEYCALIQVPCGWTNGVIPLERVKTWVRTHRWHKAFEDWDDLVWFLVDWEEVAQEFNADLQEWSGA